MNAIKLTCKYQTNGKCTVDVGFGIRAENSPSYSFTSIGTLDFVDCYDWETFRNALARGVKRPDAVFIEEGAE